jgi:hypothetical protein
MLTNEMLSDAIRLGGFQGKKKLDIVCMMNCCMQNLHTQYALHEFVSFLVAPVTWIYFPGYDYSTIFSEINTNTGITPEALAKFIVSSCERDANRPKPVVEKAHDEGIFAVELSDIGQVVSFLKENIRFENSQIVVEEEHKEYLSSLCGDPFREFEQQDTINYRLIDLYQLFVFRTFRPLPEFPDLQRMNSTSAYRQYYKGIANRFIGKNLLTINGHKITGMAMSLPDKKTYLDPRQIFVKLFYKPSRYQSKLIRFLELDKLVNTIFS